MMKRDTRNKWRIRNGLRRPVMVAAFCLSLLVLASSVYADVALPTPSALGLCGVLGAVPILFIVLGAGFLAVRSRRRPRE